MAYDVNNSTKEVKPIVLRLSVEESKTFKVLPIDSFFFVTKVSRAHGLSLGMRMILAHCHQQVCEEWEVLVVGTTHNKEEVWLDNVLVSKDPDRKDSNGRPWYARA